MNIRNYFRNWDLMRWLKLALALLSAIYALSSDDYSLFVITGWLGVSALLNVSCCSSTGCNTYTNNRSEKNPDDTTVTYNEIK